MSDHITVTHLARNLADIVNRVVYRGERFTVTRGDRPVVELVPPPTGRRLSDLPGIVQRLPRLSAEDAAALAEDIEDGRGELGALPEDPWDS